MSIADKIYPMVRHMPEERASEVLDFIEFLQQKYSATSRTEKTLRPLPVLEGFVPSGWKDAIYAIRVRETGVSTDKIIDEMNEVLAEQEVTT